MTFTITINTRVWITQKERARLDKTSLQAVSNKIRRGTIASWYIPHLDITLVKK